MHSPHRQPEARQEFVVSMRAQDVDVSAGGAAPLRRLRGRGT